LPNSNASLERVLDDPRILGLHLQRGALDRFGVARIRGLGERGHVVGARIVYWRCDLRTALVVFAFLRAVCNQGRLADVLQAEPA
jgi:hypothetical protein